jgi:hypothetical protein
MNVCTLAARAARVGALVAAIGAAGCDERLRDLTGPTPNLEPTFSSIQRDIFQTSDSSGRSLCVGCHTNVGRNPSGGLNLAGDAHAALVNVPSRGKPELMLVVPGNPDASYLIHKLEGRSGIAGLRMPRNGPPYLSDGQILVIRRWIAIGAPRD